MKIPISNRLLACAALVPRGAHVYDVGCDHGYLGVYLLKTGRAAHVTASDIRPSPLQTAVNNADRFGVTEQMDFICCSGLSAMDGSEGSVIVIAGMGGDAIAGILEACPWIRDARYTLILQPQSSGNDLRRYLGAAGFAILSEHLAEDGHFVYSALLCRFGGGRALSPGEQYVSPQLLAGRSPLLETYFSHVLGGLQKAVDGLRASRQPEDVPRLSYYETALREVKEMKLQYEHSTAGSG